MSTIGQPPASLVYGEPVWDLAELFPSQGCWSEEEYLSFDTNRRIEFTDGYLEVLAVPTTEHHLVLRFIFELMLAFVRSRDLGEVMFAGVRVRIRPEKHREPDIVYMAKAHYNRIGSKFWDGADLVVEIVSPDDKSELRDYETKVKDYAEGNIPEYWIVDPQQERIIVMTLEQGSYRKHGEFKRGAQATSVLLNGLSVDVSGAFDAGKLPL